MMCGCVVLVIFFFKQKTAYEMRISDWSSDVCSSDLEIAPEMEFATLLTQTELQIERGEFTAARDTALRLRGINAQHPYATEMLAASYEGLRAWESLRQLLPDGNSQSAPSQERYRGLLTRNPV